MTELRNLRQRLADAEARLAALEKAAKSAVQSPADRARAAARERAARDSGRYTPEQLREADRLYHESNRDIAGTQGRRALKRLLAEFPGMNHTGRALLAAAMFSQGDEQDRLLRLAVDEYDDCYYPNGVQVGPFARLLFVALHRDDDGQKEVVAAMYWELLHDYPDAIDHAGAPLAARLPRDRALARWSGLNDDM